MDIVCLGELLVDMFPAELGRTHAEVSAYRPVPGGAPANVAVAAARLGAQAAFIGKVGDDPFGHWLADVVRRAGVETRGLRFDPAVRTTMNLLAQPDANHYDCFFYRNPGADTCLRPDELDAGFLRAARAFHFGSLSLTDEPSRSATLEAVRLAREAGALVSFDVNYRPTLWRTPAEALAQVQAIVPHVKLLKVNEGELALLAGVELAIGEAPTLARSEPGQSGKETGQSGRGTGKADWLERVAAAADALLALGPTLIIVTLGPHGSYFRMAGQGGHVPGFAVDTVDATGCGDAFIAGLLWRIVQESGWRAHLPHILRFANAVGALTATRQGVIPALPTAAEVDGFLRQVS